jgi:GntR family transcriptional regulator
VETHNAIDRNSGEPLYAQIARHLRTQIESGIRTPGSSLPPEPALQDIYGVSRSVVRQALDNLAASGLISREQGRGTSVLPPAQYRRLAGRAGGLGQQIAAGGGQLSTRIIALDLRDGSPLTSTSLGTGPAWRLERVRAVDEKPVIHMITWIPQDLTPTLTSADLDGGSLHEWMRGHGLEPLGGPRQLRAVAANPDTAEYLNLPPGSPVTLLEGVTYDQHGRAIESFSAWHHPQTVFDLDAQVERPVAPARAEALLEELRSLITER